MSSLINSMGGISCQYGPWAANALELYSVWGGPVSAVYGLAGSSIIRVLESTLCFQTCKDCFINVVSSGEKKFVLARATGYVLSQAIPRLQKKVAESVPVIGPVVKHGKLLYTAVDTLTGIKQRQTRLSDSTKCVDDCTKAAAKNVGINSNPTIEGQPQIEDRVSNTNEISDNSKQPRSLDREEAFHLEFTGNLQIPMEPNDGDLVDAGQVFAFSNGHIGPKKNPGRIDMGVFNKPSPNNLLN